MSSSFRRSGQTSRPQKSKDSVSTATSRINHETRSDDDGSSVSISGSTDADISPAEDHSSAGSAVIPAATVLRHRGTKPWTGGSSLTSCGLRELDGILGSGQPLGTCILLEEDRYTDLCHVLARYWAAEVSFHINSVPIFNGCES